MDDGLFELFKILSYDELLTCSQICKDWYKVSKNELLWKLLVDKYYDDVKTIVGKNNMDKFMKCFSVKIVMNKFNINNIDVDEINVNYANLISIPPGIFLFSNLRELSLSNNNLTTISSEMCQLTNLQTLYLCNNYLTTIPSEMCQLTNLQTLYLYNNNLTTIMEIKQNLSFIANLYV